LDYETLKKHFFSMLHQVGQYLEVLALQVQKWLKLFPDRDSIENIEQQLDAGLNRKHKLMGALPLIVGLIIVFAVYGSGLLDWIVLSAAMIVVGVLVFSSATTQTK
jgi:cytoskeletal protein RodZ